MVRNVAAVAVVAALLAAAPATAQAAQWLGLGEAARQIGRSLHDKYSNIATGSLDATCWRLATNRVRCYFEYGDQAGNWYCGRGTVRETPRSYFSSWRDWRCSL